MRQAVADVPPAHTKAGTLVMTLFGARRLGALTTRSYSYCIAACPPANFGNQQASGLPAFSALFRCLLQHQAASGESSLFLKLDR